MSKSTHHCWLAETGVTGEFADSEQLYLTRKGAQRQVNAWKEIKKTEDRWFSVIRMRAEVDPIDDSDIAVNEEVELL